MKHRIIALAAALSAALPLVLASPTVLAKSQPAAQQTFGAKACMPGWPGCVPVKPSRPPPNVHLHFWFGNYPPPYYYPYDYPYQWHQHYDLPMSCKTARKRLSTAGFKSIKTLDCEGRYYAFTGLRGGHKYKITMNAFTGHYHWSVQRK